MTMDTDTYLNQSLFILSTSTHPHLN